MSAAFGAGLEALLLDGNGIGHVDHGVFAGLDRLRRLSLAANRLWSLDDGALLRGLPASIQVR